MEGEEASFFALCDGEHALPLVGAQDHKRAFDGDKGPNTGGMGAYSPAPIFDAGDVQSARCARSSCRRCGADGRGRHAVQGRALCRPDDRPRAARSLVEYNCRFGDPECQVLMMRLKSDIVPALIACADGGLKHFDLRWSNDTALTVVMATKGYPDAYPEGQRDPRPRRRRQGRGRADLPCRHQGRRQAHPGQWRTRAERHGRGAHRAGSARARLSRRRPDRLAGGLLPARYRMAGSRPAVVTPSGRPRLGSSHARFIADLSQRLLAQLRFPCGDVPEPGDIKNVAPGIYWLRMPLPFQLNHINLWLVEEKDGWTIVDYRHQHRGHARAVGEDLRREASRQAGDARHRHAPASRPCRAGRLAVRALERAALDDARRIHERHRRAQRLHRERGPARRPSGAQRRAGRQHPAVPPPQGRLRQGRGAAAAGLPAHDPRPSDHPRRPSLGRHRRPRPRARACLAVVPRAQRADRGRPGAAQDQHQCRRVAERAAWPTR